MPLDLAPHRDPDWLNAQYDNRARIPEHPVFFERWRRDSARAREQTACRLDLRYGPGAGETLDVFLPPRRDAAAPVLVFLHGGWWRAFDKSDHSFIAPAFVAAGAMVVVPNYALCPAVTIGTIAMQTARALAWTWRHAAEHGGDPARIALAGHSAGGHLAAMLLCCDWSKVDAGMPARPLRGALALSGLYDLEAIRLTPDLNVDLRLTRDDAARLSPARFDAPRGRLHALVGALESEEFLRQNALIRAAWGPAAVPVCETLAGQHHLDVLDDLTAREGRSHNLALQMLGLPDNAMLVKT
jgi:arylformamidase